jgi:hypothetical protein
MNAVSRLNVIVPLCEAHTGAFGEDARNAGRTANPHGKRQGEIASERAIQSLASERRASRDGTTRIVPSQNAPRLNAAFIAQVLGQVLPGALADSRATQAYAQPRASPLLCDIVL